MPASAFLRVSIAALACSASAPAQASAIRVLFLGGGTTSHDPAAMRDVMKPVFEKAGNDFKYVAVTRPDHGSMAGVKPPTSWDEGRVHKMLRDDLIILATLNEEKVPWTWVHPQGKGWVYYTSSGHDTRALSDPGFQGHLVQAVKWGYSAAWAKDGARRAVFVYFCTRLKAIRT